MTTALAINIVLASLAFVVIVGLATWGILTAHRDHHRLFGLHLVHRSNEPEQVAVERDLAA